MKNRWLYLKGKLVREDGLHLSALDRGFALGDGVFDTLRVAGGRVFRLEDHLDRLERAARTLAIPVPVGRAELIGDLSTLLEANRLDDALVRVTLSRGVPAERGVLPPASPAPSLVISATPFDGYPEERYGRGYRAILSRIRRNQWSPLSRIKSCNYLDSVLARMEAAVAGAEEALLLNTSGELACGSTSNVFLLRDETLLTPSIESGVLDGITRRVVLELAAGLGLPCSECRVSLRDLEEAQEVFITNTALGIMPVVAIDGAPVGGGATGPLSARLRKAYSELLTDP